MFVQHAAVPATCSCRFGRTFDYQNEAVSIARGGITDKPHGWRQKGVMLLGVEDPQQVSYTILL